MAFGKKNKNHIGGHEKSEVAIKYGFRISTPNGYFPEDVDKLVLKLEEQLNTLTKETQILQEKNEQLTADFKTVQKANNELRLQMMQIQESTNELQDFSNLAKLASINPSVGDMPEIQPIEPLKADIPIDIVQDTPVFDDLISPEKEKSKEEVKVKPKFSLVDIYGDDGKLEIL